MAVDTNAVLNYEELAKMLGRTVLSVKHAVSKLRANGKLPKFCKINQVEKYGSYYSDREKQMILKLRYTHTHEEIAQIMGRTKDGIESVCRKQGPVLIKAWNEDDEALLIKTIKFDHYGVTANYGELQQVLHRNIGSIQAKIRRLRIQGKLPKAIRTGMPENKRAKYARYFGKQIWRRADDETN